MFCGCTTVFGGEPEHAGLPGLPGPAGRAAGGQRGGGGVGRPDRPGAATARSRRGAGSRGRTTSTRTCRRTSRPRQYDEPIAFDGYLDVELDGKTRPVEIERAHMEEDTGKSLHVGGATGRIHGAEYSLVDYNRAGIPLIEIVTKPLDRARASGPPRWPAPTSRRCATCCARSTSPTCGWSRARCAATRTSRCAGRDNAIRAPAPRPRTSTRCAASSGPSATR